MIEYAQFLNPQKRNSQTTMSSICNLALKIVKVFCSRSSLVLNVCPDKSLDDIADIIRNQWRIYQAEAIPESMYFCQTSKTKPVNVSYWNYYLKYCGIFSDSTDNSQSNHIRIDDLRKSVGSMMNDDGNLKYPQLFALPKALLSISHGNVVPERGFSLNKYMLSIHGNNLEVENIISLRIVKDELCLRGGLKNVKITKQLLRSVHPAHAGTFFSIVKIDF